MASTIVSSLDGATRTATHLALGRGSDPSPHRDRRDESTSSAPSASREQGGELPSDSNSAELSIDADLPARIGHYELIRELGRGGMGRVYLARDTKLGRKVAVKFIEVSAPAARERFIAEARATAVCNHENIVVIHEVDSLGDQPYMVLEYVDGEPLSKLIRKEPLPPARVIELAIAIVRGLKRAHELGIVHRDLKNDNVLVTRTGQVKILDFGLAREIDCGEAALATLPADGPSRSPELSATGSIMGTPSYMAPEQFGFGTIDHRVDFYALGIMLYRLLTGRHPLPKLDLAGYYGNASRLREPMPSLAQQAPHLPRQLIDLVDRCLAKDKQYRWSHCDELLRALEAQRSETGRRLADGECPYPGLTAFSESDAHRFFGRTKDVERITSRLRRRPLIVVVGPSGAGKSSVIRAGVIPALRQGGESWNIHHVRPGRSPVRALAEVLAPEEPGTSRIAAQLHSEPGYFGAVLRARAKNDACKYLVFVDQFEELYTMTADPAERATFTTALAGAADDNSSPIRVILCMRSDFIDHIAESQLGFADDFVRGITMLAPPDSAALRETIEQPLELTGYRFETEQTIAAMVAEVASATGPLPLLQFAATKLWALRDERTRTIPHASYHQIGGVAGALAQHADEVLAGLSGPMRKLCRAFFVRLVTPERTRAIVQLEEFRDLGGNPSELKRLVALLVEARLLVTQARGEEDAAVEIVHESLVTSWPTLARWLDESHEDTAFLQHLRMSAKTWEERGRPQSLLWSGETADEALLWQRRNAQYALTGREKAFMDEVTALATRAVRRRRRVVGTIMASLAIVALGAVVASIRVVRAEENASQQAHFARLEATRARTAEQQARSQLELAMARQQERDAARKSAELERARVESKDQELGLSRVELESANARLASALERAKEAQARSAVAAERAEALLRLERDRANRLQEERKKITTKLP